MNKIYKKAFALIVAMVMIVPMLSMISISAVSAATTNVNENNFWGGATGKANVSGNIGLGTTDPRTVVANVIQAALGFLGIVAVIIILLGGFKYMTAGGEEGKVDEAKKLIMSGIIGLVIILSAFGIATFVISSLTTATQ